MPCSQKFGKIAFTGSTGPGMSGGPLAFFDKEGKLYSCGIYNGPAAMPGHRLFALLQFTDAIER